MTSIFRRIRTFLAILTILSGICFAETYHLSDQQGWQNVQNSPQSEYLLAISKIKQQLMTGTESDVVNALEQLKKDFPEMAGEEIESYLAAERLYAKGKWYKAATAYKKYIDAWPISVLQPAAMERFYSIATAYLQGQKRTYIKIISLPAFDTGVELMRDVADRAGTSPLGLRALTTLAEAQEGRKMLVEAYYTWEEIANRWPTGKIRQQAVLRMAQTLHASYDGTQYDAAVLASARSYFEDYQMQYPQEAAKLKLDETMTMITEQLAYKEYEMGFYYERTGSIDAARQYYNKVIAEWPDSKAAKMAQARLAPNAVPAVKKTIRRRAVDGTGRFLDNWFGLQPLFKSEKKEQTQI